MNRKEQLIIGILAGITLAAALLVGVFTGQL
jgi:hypothetical protein